MRPLSPESWPTLGVCGALSGLCVWSLQWSLVPSTAVWWSVPIALALGVLAGCRLAPGRLRSALLMLLALPYAALASAMVVRCEPCSVDMPSCGPCLHWARVVCTAAAALSFSAGLVLMLRTLTARQHRAERS
jgi:hypothetical protein